jgi:hypothetical protein
MDCAMAGTSDPLLDLHAVTADVEIGAQDTLESVQDLQAVLKLPELVEEAQRLISHH